MIRNQAVAYNLFHDGQESIIARQNARIREGDITTAQAQKEGQLLSNLLKAYDAVELQAKLDALEAVIGGRR